MSPFAFLFLLVLGVAVFLVWKSFSRCFSGNQDYILCIADCSRRRRLRKEGPAQMRAAIVPRLSFAAGGMMNTELNGNIAQGDLERKKEKLLMDIKSVLADADDLLNEVSDATVEEFAAVCTKVEEKLADARCRLDEVRNVAVTKAQGVAEYVGTNPGKSLGAAAVAGVVIGIALGRR